MKEAQANPAKSMKFYPQLKKEKSHEIAYKALIMLSTIGMRLSKETY